MRVLVAPDSFGGTLTAGDVTAAIVAGWRGVRPDDDVAPCPLSDGGEGLLSAVRQPGDETTTVEVAGPLSRPVTAELLLREDGSAVIESALACGLALVPPERRNPLQTTTYGVGQLLEHARERGVRAIHVGLGGSSTVDGGAGALLGLGFRLTVADGSGLKVGGADLHRVAAAEPTWVHRDWAELPVTVLADVHTPLLEAARVFGPQKGADEATIDVLEDGLLAWAEVVERDLATPGLRDEPGTGAAGGLGYGLAAGLDARIARGAAVVADLLGVEAELHASDLVITGEGRLDATSFEGKVVGEVAERARAAGIPVLAVVGGVAGGAADRLDGVATTAGGEETEDPAAAVADAAASLARGL